MNKNIIIAVTATLFVAGGGGFFTGMKYQESKTPSFARMFDNNGQVGNMQFSGRNGNSTESGMRGFSPVSGEIIESDDKSITVKESDGSSKIVFITENSTVNKTEEGSKDDLATGTKVVIFGQSNSDGSITAQSIQIGGVAGERMMPSGQ